MRRRQHTSAYVSIRQHTSAYVSIRQHERMRAARQHAGASGVSICTFVLVNQVKRVQVSRASPQRRRRGEVQLVFVRLS